MDTPTSDGFDLSSVEGLISDEDEDDDAAAVSSNRVRSVARRGFTAYQNRKKERTNRGKLESQHPQLLTMWNTLEEMPPLKAGRAEQPKNISRLLKPFQLEGLAWMKAMEQQTEWKGGLLGDEMGLGKTIQAVSPTTHLKLLDTDNPANRSH